MGWKKEKRGITKVDRGIEVKDGFIEEKERSSQNYREILGLYFAQKRAPIEKEALGKTSNWL